MIALSLLGLLASAPAQNSLNIPMPSPDQVRRCFPPGTSDTTPMAGLSAEQRRALTACAQALVADQINSVAPRAVDEVTTLQSASATGTTLQYNYQLALDAAQVSAAARSQVEQATRTFVCGEPNMRATMSNGGAYRYVWNDRAGQLVHQVLITSCP